AFLVLLGAVAALWQSSLDGAPDSPASWSTPSTAVAGLLAGTALLVGGPSPATGAMLGVGVLALGVLGLTGRVLGLLSTFVGMTPWLAALGCALVGAALALRKGFGLATRTDLAAR